MKTYICTDCKKEKIAKDFPNMWRAEKDRPWRYCTVCVQKHYGKNAAKFTDDAVLAAIADFKDKQCCD
jgi:hypothetical protein